MSKMPSEKPVLMPGERLDDLQRDGLRIIQNPSWFCFGMDAVLLSGSTDNFVVKVTESQEAANAVATALANKYPDMTGIKYFAMDINLYDVTGNNQITDTSNLSVNTTMPPIMQQIAPRTPNVSINQVQVTVTPFPPFPFLHSG